MNPEIKRWTFLALTTFTLGSASSLIETGISKSIDSFLPDGKAIASFHRPGTITILSTDGEIIQKLGPATREKVVSKEMPVVLRQAFISAEDRRFYSHNGVDLWGISRAIISNLREGYVKEGGSTITQQLARLVFLSQERTIARKLKEAALAYKLERQLSKEEILEQYLNNVYLGSGAYGVADAAWVYFSKKVNDLSLAETALIAGLPPAPSLYSPLVSPRLAIQRRTLVLQRMYQSGFISEQEADQANSSELILKPAIPKYFNSAAPFFSTWVTKKLPEILTPEQIELGGLKIRTSLNLNWQKEAETIIRLYSPGETEGSIVSIEPKTGLVRVMVGGKDFRVTQFNRATQALRSPGSTFKLFPYAAAISAGLKPEDKFLDAPRCWDGYCPQNFGGKYMGVVSMTDAFKNSLNIVAVQILERVGFEKVIETANNLGIGNERKLGRYFPLAIGAYEQTVLDMTGAYAAVTNRGIYMRPTPFEEILGPKNILLWERRENGYIGKRALKKEVADTLNWMLQGVVKSGTGIAASLKDRPVAGKTGTSEGGRDLWFIGSIPQLTTGIWFGYDDNKETKSGSGEAAWAWKQFMTKIKKDFPTILFPKRPN